jgi:hypothetical protein
VCYFSLFSFYVNVVAVLLIECSNYFLFVFRNHNDILSTDRPPIENIRRKPKSQKTKVQKETNSAQLKEFHEVISMELTTFNSASLRQTRHKVRDGDTSNALLTSSTSLKSSSHISAWCPVSRCKHASGFANRSGGAMKSHFRTHFSAINYEERFLQWINSGFLVRT